MLHSTCQSFDLKAHIDSNGCIDSLDYILILTQDSDRTRIGLS